MLRTFLAFISLVVLLLGVAMSTWYLTHPESWNWRSLGSLLADDSAPVQEAVAVPARFVSPPLPDPQVRIPAPVTEAPDTQSNIREEVTLAACALPDTVNVTRGQDSIIYSWRDENGRLTVSDKPPPSPTIEVRTTNYWADPEYFELNVKYSGASEIANFRSDLTQDATAIYKILAGLIGENSLRKVNLNIVIYPDRTTYVQYANSVNDRDMQSTNGFYSVRSNEAVTYVHGQRAAMMETVRHESTHLIATGIFGLIPVWLHEGLAEYFSSLNIVAQSKQISLNDESLARARDAIRSGYPRRLRDFLALSPSAWSAANIERHYALAETLVFFMMSSDRGRQALSSLLRETVAQYCQKTNTTLLLNQLYSGGIGRLENDYVDWLMDGQRKPAHHF